MGLYDSYRLRNSTAIPTYVGSTLPEITKYYDNAQQYYDAASTTDLNTSDLVQNSPFLQQDTGTWEKMNTGFQSEMKGRIEAGDYENMYGIVSQRARQMATRLKPLVQQVQNKQAYIQSLDEKGLNLSEKNKSIYRMMAEDKYRGVQFDGNGRVIAGTEYRGDAASKMIDPNEKIRNALSIMHEYAGKNIRKGDNGEWKYETADGWKAIRPADVLKVYQAGVENDPEWKAHNQQEIQLNTYARTRGATDNGIAQAIQQMDNTNPLKQSITGLMQKGYSPAQAYARIVEHEESENLNKYQKQYALGKAYTETETTRSSGVGDAWALRFKKKLDEEGDNPYLVQGPETKLTDDEQDVDKVRDNNLKSSNNLATLQTQVEMYTQQLKSGNIPAAQKTQLQLKLADANEQIAGVTKAMQRSEQLMTYAKNKQAQEMGYTDLGDFERKEAAKITSKVAQRFPKGDFGLSAPELAQAIVSGRVKAIPSSDSGSPRFMLKAEDGTSKIVKSTDGYNINGLIFDATNGKKTRTSELEAGVQKNYKSQVADYSIKTEVIAIPKKQRDEITTVLKGATGGIEFSEPGQFNNMDESDRPINYKVVGVTPEGTENGLIFKVEGLDEKGQPTGKFYDAKTKNSNIGEILAKEWNKGDATSKSLANMVRFGSGARTIHSMVPGKSMELGEATIGEQTKKVTLDVSRIGGKVVYSLRDDSGLLKKPDGSDYSTTSTSVAGAWVDKFKQ